MAAESKCRRERQDVSAWWWGSFRGWKGGGGRLRVLAQVCLSWWWTASGVVTACASNLEVDECSVVL